MIPCTQDTTLERLEKKIDKISDDVQDLKYFKMKVTGAFIAISIIATVGWRFVEKFL